MAKVKEISFSMSQKISRDYNSIGVETGETVTLDDGDDPKVIFDEVRGRVMTRMVEAIKPLIKPR